MCVCVIVFYFIVFCCFFFVLGLGIAYFFFSGWVAVVDFIDKFSPQPSGPSVRSGGFFLYSPDGIPWGGLK